jgi:hypothetical protein
MLTRECIAAGRRDIQIYIMYGTFKSSGVENKDLHWEAKISTRHASILKQFAITLELFNKKSLEYQLLVWLCEQLQAAHLSGAKCIFSGAFAPELQTISNPWKSLYLFLLEKYNSQDYIQDNLYCYEMKGLNWGVKISSSDMSVKLTHHLLPQYQLCHGLCHLSECHRGRWIQVHNKHERRPHFMFYGIRYGCEVTKLGSTEMVWFPRNVVVSMYSICPFQRLHQ